MNQKSNESGAITGGWGCAAPVPPAQAMTVSALRAALAAAPVLPLTVLWPDGDAIEAHFHVTEVGRVQKDFVDCGGTLRRTVTCLLQTWVGDDVDHRITAGKLLKAFEHAGPVLGGEDLPVELEYEACNVVQFFVTAVVTKSDRLVVQLGGKHTDCLAKELCVPSSRLAGEGTGCC
ncbi:MAG: DUF6428 family protein [Opitutaceae bacterium]